MIDGNAGRICIECTLFLPAEDCGNGTFDPKRNIYYPRSQCLECRKKQRRERELRERKADPELFKKNQRERSKKYANRVQIRARRHNTTKEFLLNMLENQKNKCQICMEALDSKWAVDHCHLKGHIRGILCRRCNTGLGCFEDNIEFLKKAITYLEKYQ